ncbi:MAG: D-alanyl-D-alanine carboxypeptidase [Clostridia bacterium]|nr:D-alanyl-D-alanine carboxypeptidase [Clostridia bacterium]
MMITLNFNIQFVMADGEPELAAPSALLMENSTGKILYDKNSHERRPMASITKIMTMLLAMEEIDAGRMEYDDMITGSAYAKSMGGSTIFLDEGEQLSVRDIMKGIAVSSGNDAAVAMAEHISGSEETFVARMNERAAGLGMVDTHFVNCNGLDAEGHYSSAYDIALMSRELLKHPDIHNFTTIWMDTLRDGKFTLSNTNKLIRFYEGATGLKTGSTSDALFCVSGTAKRDNMHLIAVIMASPTSKERVADASKLLNYGFANYAIKPVSNAGDIVGEQAISKGVKRTTDLLIKEPFEVLAKKGETPQVEMKPVLTSEFVAPIEAGTPAGIMEYYIDGQKAGESEIVFSENIEKIKFSDIFMRMVRLWASGCAQRV